MKILECIKNIIRIIINNEVFYVGSLDKLPGPLNRDDEEKYITLSINGDKTYKMDKNIKLATYASRCIDNEILMFLRKNKKRKGEVSFEDSLSYDAEGNELHLEDILGTDANIVSKGLDDATDKKLLYQELSKLNPRDKQIMSYRYGLFNHKEMTQKEVAQTLGISQSYISRIEKKVIKRLKNISKI